MIKLHEQTAILFEPNDPNQKSFTLTNGIDGGLNNVNVQLTWSCGGKNNWRASKSMNFKDGENVTATLNNDGQGGCRGVLE